MKKLLLALILCLVMVASIATPVSADASQVYEISFGMDGMNSIDYLHGTVKYKAEHGETYPYASIQNGAGRDAFLSKLYGTITIENVKYNIIVKPSAKNIPAEFELSNPPSSDWAWTYSLPVQVTFNGEKCSGSLGWTVRTIAPDHYVYKIIAVQNN